jgi:hypothetical protein
LNVVLQRYIESQLAARLGKEVDEGRQRLSRQQQEELELYKMPEGLEVRCPAVTMHAECDICRSAKKLRIVRLPRMCTAATHCPDTHGTN